MLLKRGAPDPYGRLWLGSVDACYCSWWPLVYWEQLRCVIREINFFPVKQRLVFY